MKIVIMCVFTAQEIIAEHSMTQGYVIGCGWRKDRTRIRGDY